LSPRPFSKSTGAVERNRREKAKKTVENFGAVEKAESWKRKMLTFAAEIKKCLTCFIKFEVWENCE
jgi:cob(I)alamin adenosyltransferase